MHTGACRDSYLFVEKTFTLSICQIPDLKRYTHESLPSSTAGKQANCVNRLIQLCTHFPKNQIGQTRPLQEHSGISRCHSPAAVRIDLYRANTRRYSSFLSQHQRKVFNPNTKKLKSTCNVCSCPVEQTSLIQLSRYSY